MALLNRTEQSTASITHTVFPDVKEKVIKEGVQTHWGKGPLLGFTASVNSLRKCTKCSPVYLPGLKSEK